MASYEEINYAIRPNKRTQRKMIFEALRRYVSIFPERTFRYVGFGSMWFSDFFYAHRSLGVNDLISIEREDGYKRALFNRPFKCIRVLAGDSTRILPRLRWVQPNIVWLDYDFLPEQESLMDLGYLATNLVSGSVLMTTFDARPPWKDGTKSKQRAAVLRRVFGSSVPANLSAAQLDPDNYHTTLAGILWTHLKDTLVKSGRLRQDGLPVSYTHLRAHET